MIGTTDWILTIYDSHRKGYIFWQLGEFEEARYYFDKQIIDCQRAIELNRIPSSRLFAHYDLVCIYSFYKDYDKAFQYLEELGEKSFYPKWMLTSFKYDPLLDNIRDDPRFKAFQLQAEEQYQAEHERVRVWLEEEGLR